MTTQRSEAHGDVWIVEWQRIGGDMEQEEFHTLTAANKFYDELMDSEDDFEFINEPWLAEGADEKFIKGKTMKSESIEDLRDRAVSSGTLKSEDLIPKFLGVLKTYGKDKYDKYIKENPEVEDWKNLDEETMGWVVDELTDLLNEIAPDGCYFGASEGDGADFGFWSMSNESKKKEGRGEYISRTPQDDVWGKKRLMDVVNAVGVPAKTSKIVISASTGDGPTATLSRLDNHQFSTDAIFDGHPDVRFSVVYSDARGRFYVHRYTKAPEGSKWAWDRDWSRNGMCATYDEKEVVQFIKDNWDVATPDGASNESKKSEADGNKDIFTLDLTRIDADGDEEGLDDMQAAQTFYDEDDAIKAAKELADSYKDDDGVVQVIVMAGEQEKPNGDIVGDSFDIYWASSSDKQTTADYRKKARYAAFDNKMDYYAKGGKSEAYEDIWRGAKVVSFEDATDYIALPADEEQELINKYGEDYYDNPDAMDEYSEALDDYIVSMFDQDFVSIDGEEIPLGLCREPKILIVQDIDHTGGDKAIELVKKLANGELTGSSDDGDYVAIMDGVNGSPHFDIYSEGGKSEGNDDDKGCKGKDCKDDKTKKNEADATFKVGDFVNYDAESDGKDVYDSFIPCEVVDVNDDGTLGLCVYGSYVNEEGLGENASASCCSKLDHYAGMVDANHYYMGGKYNAYKGGWEILITDKELNPKVYEFIGTIDDLSEVLDIDDFYGGENFVFDEDLKDEVANNTGWDVETTTFAGMTGDVGESKKSEARPTKQDAQIKELCKLCRNDKNVADSVFKALTKDYNTSLDPVLAGQYLTATWKSKLEELGGCNGWYDGFKKLYAAMGSDFVCSVLQDLKLGSSEIGCGACISIVDTIYDKVVKHNESKQTEGLPPKKLGNRLYRSRADLINKMKTLDAVEITTPAQFNDIHSKQWLHTAGYALDTNGNLIGQTYFGDKDGKWYYATTKTFQGDYLPECKEEAKKSEKASVTCSICGNPTDDPIWGEGNRAFCKDCYSDGDDFKHGKTKFVVGMMISLDGVKQYIRELKPRTFVGQSVDTGKEFSLPISSLNRASILYDPRNESKKSEAYNWIAFYFCKDKRTGTEYAVIPQDRVFVVGNGGGRYNLSYLDANGHWDRLSYGYFATSCEPISDPENSKVYATVKADEDRRIIALTESEFDTIVEADDAVKTVKSIVANNYESKKSESLTLKQKELKDMARFGQAEDITTISDEEAKALRKKGIETIGVSRHQ